MKLKNMFAKFFNDESGAVTVDWVVLTAAVVILGAIVVANVRSGLEDVSTDIETSLTNMEVPTIPGTN